MASRLLLTHQDTQRPSDLWVYDIAAGKPRQLSYSAVAGLNPNDLPAAQVVHYKSFDGKIISAFALDAVQPEARWFQSGRRPAARRSHGTDGRQLQLHGRCAVVAGIPVIAPNVRGSTGYGVAFQKANYQDLGGGDLQDEVYATKFLLDYRLRRREKDRHHRRFLWRIHDPDGHRQIT